MSNVRDSSKEAFEYCNEHGITQRQQKEIVKAMMGSKDKMTRHEIAEATGIDTSSVSARVNRMLKDKCLCEVGKTTCSVTGRTAYAVKLMEA